jgi:hypothetical protein
MFYCDFEQEFAYNPQIKLGLHNFHRKTSNRLYPAETSINYIQLFLLLCSVKIISRELYPKHSENLLLFCRSWPSIYRSVFIFNDYVQLSENIRVPITTTNRKSRCKVSSLSVELQMDNRNMDTKLYIIEICTKINSEHVFGTKIDKIS